MMSSSAPYSTYAQVALAAYATELLAGGNNTNRYLAPDRMSASQAAAFDATWNVIQQSAHDIYGFSAVLLERSAPEIRQLLT